METKKQSPIFSNKRIITLCVFCFFINTIIQAQDKIMLISGDELSVKVMEITDTEIKYKRENDASGPLRVISKASVFSITYPNGNKEVYGQATKNTVNEDDVYIAPVNPNSTLLPGVANADGFVPEKKKKFSGPRIGLTYITPGTVSDFITDKGKHPFITQIGWQFEQRIFTTANGTSGLIEFIPLFGGMEQGMFLPSANLLIGLRAGSHRSVEFALGPNVSLSGLGMVFAAGCSFHSGNINFPVNIAVVPSVSSKKDVYDPTTKTNVSKFFETGWRVSLTVGFNLRKR